LQIAHQRRQPAVTRIGGQPAAPRSGTGSSTLQIAHQRRLIAVPCISTSTRG
jgi:hypothetical protein